MTNQSNANPAYRHTGKKKPVIDRNAAFAGLNNPKPASATDQTPKAIGKKPTAAEVRLKAFDLLNNPKAHA